MVSVACGVDIGGSGIKGALVDLDEGTIIGARMKLPTPLPATPQAVSAVVRQVLDGLGAGPEMPVGVTIPAPIHGGLIPFMANLAPEWEGTRAVSVLSDFLGRPVAVLNDADAAGLAEAEYGAAKDTPGLVIVTTLGTGIGSAIIHRGVLIPNSELGHLELDGVDAETRASAKRRVAEDLTWPEWTARLQRYYSHLEMLFSPDLLVVGGGVSRRHEHFLPNLQLRTPIVPAKLYNSAGIVGAALAAAIEERAR